MRKLVIFLLLGIMALIVFTTPKLAYCQDNAHAAGVTSVLIRTLKEPIPEPEEVEVVEEVEEYILIESTAYYDKYNRRCADGTKPHVGVLAGKKEWLGKSVELYDLNMNYLGEYVFHDVGYGQSTGFGKSVLVRGKTIGTIE